MQNYNYEAGNAYDQVNSIVIDPAGNVIVRWRRDNDASFVTGEHSVGFEKAHFCPLLVEVN